MDRFWSLGIKQSSAQITKRHSLTDLDGGQILAVTNFPPRKVADFISEVLVLGIEIADGDVILISPDAEVPSGSLIS